MRVTDDIPVPGKVDRDRIARLEERVTRLEAHLGALENSAARITPAPPGPLAPVFSNRPQARRDLELEVGQHWFGLAGVAVMTAGLLFLLSLPYAGAPAPVPGLAGALLAGVLIFIGRTWPRIFPGAGPSLHAAALALLGFASLRLFLFGPTPALDPNGLPALALLAGVLGLNVTVGMRHRSSGLTALALAIGCAVSLAMGSASLVILTLAVVALVMVFASRRGHSAGLLVAGALLAHPTYFLWALGNPLRNGAAHFVREPGWAPATYLALLLLMAAAPLFRPQQRAEAAVNVAAFVNCAFGYGAFLLHTAAVFQPAFAAHHFAAALASIALALAFHVRIQGRVSTFFYAMTGYAALTLAIVKVTRAPDVFVWLSAQSVLVVATAIWFRSRSIVVGNFFIFAAIVATYMATTKAESGISIVFGAVALVTAHILEWKQHRLELKTELMRNAYLASAFVIFPYAAYHFVPVRYVAVAWIVLAGGYYLASVVVQSPKYRWMGHGTLVLTTLFVTGTAVSRFEPVYRVLSFLILGATLLTVSLLFARSRRRGGSDMGL